DGARHAGRRISRGRHPRAPGAGELRRARRAARPRRSRRVAAVAARAPGGARDAGAARAAVGGGALRHLAQRASPRGGPRLRRFRHGEGAFRRREAAALSSWVDVYHRLPAPLREAGASLHGYRLRSWRYGPETDPLIAETLERDRWDAAQWERWRAERPPRMLGPPR